MADLSAQGPILGSFATSLSVNTSPPPLPLGARMRDNVGNEYIFCDFVGPAFGGTPVEIFDDNTCQQLGTTGRGRVGVACGVMTSNDFGWVQIYGRCLVQLGMSGVSPSDAANGPTTINTSLATVFCLGTSLTSPNGIGYVSGAAAAATSTLLYVIEGIRVATDTSIGKVSAVTSATSHTGNQVGVFLNYPMIRPTDITT